jgi:hypothetical protein
MGHSDSLGMGNQNPKPSHPHSRPVNEKLTYRLFPTANQQPQVSPKTLQQQTLQRNGSFNKRRSVSLDESSRSHGVARIPFSRPGDAPVPRIQKVPSNRVKVTKPDGQDRTCTSPGNRRLPDNADDPKAQAPKIMVYKPRISEDAGHGRSSSAPDDMRAEVRPRKTTGLAHMTNAALASSAKAVRGLGGTWYNPHDSTIGGPVRGDTQAQHDRRDPKLEKPLPLPPRESGSQMALDPYHSRSHSTPLSPGPRSTYHIGARSDSVTDLAPLVTPSSLDPNRKSYFPLSADAQMRQLMGFSPIEDGKDESARFHSRQKSRGLGVPYTLPSSRYQRPVDIPIIKVNTELTDKPTNRSHYGSPETSQPVPAPAEYTSPIRPSLPSPTFSQASVVPAALRITSPKRSASVSSSLDRRPLPLQTRVRAANDSQPVQALTATSTAISVTTPKADEVANTLSVLSELTTQTDTLHARYASLREDRQTLLSTISHGLKEQKAGPDYVNTIFDQHMSLSTVCSSMDICLAKLKAVARRKDALIQTLVTPAPTKPLLPSIDEQKSAPVSFSARSTPAMSSSHKMSLSTPSSLQFSKVDAASRSGYPEAMRRFQSKLDIDYDTDDSDAPRRMNIKGAKAAKILGLALEADTSPEIRSSEFSATRPIHTLKANHSTTSLDRDHFTRTPSPALSPAPDRPLPARPSVSMRTRDHVPTPLPLKPIEKSIVEKTPYTAPIPVNDSAVSSRASSPADERGAETPHEEYPSFDAKSPGMQTVHVYFPDSMSGTPSLHSSTFSEVGEDELLAYYGYLR